MKKEKILIPDFSSKLLVSGGSGAGKDMFITSYLNKHYKNNLENTVFFCSQDCIKNISHNYILSKKYNYDFYYTNINEENQKIKIVSGSKINNFVMFEKQTLQNNKEIFAKQIMEIIKNPNILIIFNQDFLCLFSEMQKNLLSLSSNKMIFIEDRNYYFGTERLYMCLHEKDSVTRDFKPMEAFYNGEKIRIPHINFINTKNVDINPKEI